MDDRLKQTNLFRKLIKAAKTVFMWLIEQIKSKAKKSLYEKDKIFCKYYFDFENKNVLQEGDTTKTSISFYTPFLEQRKDRSAALYIIKASFELLHADIADIQFFSNYAVDRKYCLVVVNLFTSKTYSYPMKSSNLLAQKMNLSYQDIDLMREQVHKKTSEQDG